MKKPTSSMLGDYRACAVLLISAFLFACPAPGGGGSGGAAGATGALFSHNSYTFGARLVAEGRVESGDIATVTPDRLAIRAQIAQRVQDLDGNPVTAADIPDSLIGNINFAINPQDVAFGELDPANLFFSVSTISGGRGRIRITIDAALGVDWTYGQIANLLDNGRLSIRLTTSINETLLAAEALQLIEGQSTEITDNVFVEIRPLPAGTPNPLDLITYDPSLLRQAGMDETEDTYRFTLSNEVAENNELNQILEFPRLNQASGSVSNPQDAYGLPRAADGYTLFYELRDSANPIAECAGGMIYFDNGDFRIRAGDILNFETTTNPLSCRFAVSGTGVSTDFDFIGLALPSGSQVESAEQVTNSANVILVADVNNQTTTNPDGTSARFDVADCTTDFDCYFASVEVGVTNVDEAPTIVLSTTIGGDAIRNPAQRDFGDVTEGLLVLPAYQASQAAVGGSVPSAAELAALPEQTPLNASADGSPLFLRLEDVDDGAIVMQESISITNIDPNHQLAATHPLFSAADGITRIGDILDQLFALSEVPNEPGQATLSVNRQFLDYESFPQDRIENDIATYTITFSADNATNREFSAEPVRATFNLADVRFAPVFVNTSGSEPAAPSSSINVPELIRMGSALIPEAGVNIDRENAVLTLLPGFRALLQSRLGTISAVNPETGDGYDDQEISYSIQPLDADAAIIAPNLAMIPAQLGTPAVSSGRLIVASPALSETAADASPQIALIASIESNNPASPLATQQTLIINVAENAVEGTDPALDMDVNNFAPNIEIANGIVIATAPETPGNTLTGANGNANFVNLTSQPLDLSRPFNSAVDNLRTALGIDPNLDVTYSLLPASFAAQLGSGANIGVSFPRTLIADIQTLGIDLAAEQDVFFMRDATTGVIGIRPDRQIDFNRVYNLLVVVNPTASPDPNDDSYDPRVFNTNGGSNLALVNLYPTDIAEAPRITPVAVNITEDENAAFSRSFTITDDQALSGISISLNASDGMSLVSDDLSNAITATRDGNTITLASEGLDFEDATLRQEIEDFTLRIADQGVFSWFGGPTGIRTAPALASAAASMSASAAINITLNDIDEGIDFTLTGDSGIQSLNENLENGMSINVATLTISGGFPTGPVTQDSLSRNISLSFANDRNSQFFAGALRPVLGDPTSTDPISVPVALEVTDTDELGRLGDGVTFEDVTIVASEILRSTAVRAANTDDASFTLFISNRPPATQVNNPAELLSAIRSMDNVNNPLGTIGEDASFAFGSVLSSPTNIPFAQIPFSALATETDEFYRFPGGVAVRRATPLLSFTAEENANRAELEISPDLANEQVIRIVAPPESHLNNPNIADPVYTLELLNRGFIEASLFGNIILNLNATLSDGDILLDGSNARVTLSVEEPDIKSVEFENPARNARMTSGQTLMPDQTFDGIYDITYTQTALPEPLQLSEDQRLTQATNISNDDDNADTPETLDLRSSDNDFVRLVAQDLVYNTVTIAGSTYIARDITERATNRFGGSEIVDPATTTLAGEVLINLDILDDNIDDFVLASAAADSLSFEILTQDEETGNLVSAAGEVLSGDPALNFRAYWNQPRLNLVRDANGDLMMDADGNLIPQINITQRTYDVINSDGSEAGVYNALDTLQLYDGTTNDEANLQYFIRVGTDADFNNASNYAMAQFNVQVTPARVGQGTEVLGIALLPTGTSFDPDSVTLPADIAAAPLVDDDAIAATRMAIQAALNTAATANGRGASFADGDFTLSAINQNGMGITGFMPNDFSTLDLVVVLGNVDGETNDESPSIIRAELEGGEVTGTDATRGELIALRDPAMTSVAPTANTNAEVMGEDFTADNPDDIYAVSFDFALAQNYEGTANFPISITEQTEENGELVAGDRNRFDIIIPVEDVAPTADRFTVEASGSGIVFTTSTGTSPLGNFQDGTASTDAILFTEPISTTNIDISFSVTGFPTTPDMSNIGALGRTASALVRFNPTPQEGEDNPGVGTADFVNELFVREATSAANMLTYKNNAWGSDTIIHTISYSEPRGFGLVNASYTENFSHFINVDNSNDPTTVVAPTFRATPLMAAGLLSATSISGTGNVTLQDADFEYDNNRARVLGANNMADPNAAYIVPGRFSSTPARDGLTIQFTTGPRVLASTAVATDNQAIVEFAYAVSAISGMEDDRETSARQADPGSYGILLDLPGTNNLAVGNIVFEDIDNDAMLATQTSSILQSDPAGTQVINITLTDNDLAKLQDNRGTFTFADLSVGLAVANSARIELPVEFASSGVTISGNSLTNIIETNQLLNNFHEGAHQINFTISDSKFENTGTFTVSLIVAVRGVPEPATIDATSVRVLPSGTAIPAGSDNSGAVAMHNQVRDTTFTASLSYMDPDFSDLASAPPVHDRLQFTSLVVTFEEAGSTDTYDCTLSMPGVIDGVGTGGAADPATNTQTITDAPILRGIGESATALTLGDIIMRHNAVSVTTNRCNDPRLGDSITGFTFNGLALYQSIAGADPTEEARDGGNTPVATTTNGVTANVITGYRDDVPPTIVSAGDIEMLVANNTEQTARLVFSITDTDPDDGSPAQTSTDLAGMNGDLIDRTTSPSASPWNEGAIVVSAQGTCPLPNAGFPENRRQVFDITGSEGLANATLSLDFNYRIAIDDLLMGQSWTCNFLVTGLEDGAIVPNVAVTFSTDTQPAFDFSIVRQPSDDYTDADIDRTGISGTPNPLSTTFARLSEATNRVDNAVIGNFTIEDDGINRVPPSRERPNGGPVGTHVFSFTSGARDLVSFNPHINRPVYDGLFTNIGGIRVNRINVANGPTLLSPDGNTLTNGSVVQWVSEEPLFRGQAVGNINRRQALFNLNRSLTPQDIGRHTVGWSISDDLTPSGEVRTLSGSFNITIDREDNTSIEDVRIESVQAVNSAGVPNPNGLLSNAPVLGGAQNLQASISYRDDDFLESFNFANTEIEDSVVHRGLGFSNITFTFEAADNLGVASQFTCVVVDGLSIGDMTAPANVAYGRDADGLDDDLAIVTGLIFIQGNRLSYADIQAGAPLPESDARCADIPIGAGIVQTSMGGLVVAQAFASAVTTADRNAVGLTGLGNSVPQDVTSVLLSGADVEVNVSGFRTEEVDGTIAEGGVHSVVGSTATSVDLEIVNNAQPILLRATLTDGDIDDGYPALPAGIAANPNPVNRGSSNAANEWPAVNSQSGINVALAAVSGDTCALAGDATPMILAGDMRDGFGITLTISIPVTSLTNEGDTGNCSITLDGLEDGRSNNQLSFSYRRVAPPPDADGDGVFNSVDRDADGDGLIDIANVEQLVNISMDLDANGRLDTTNTFGAFIPGCAVTANQPTCNGYELVDDIDLAGVDWIPLGEDDTNNPNSAFNTTFEGNGFRVNNMRIIINSTLPQRAGDTSATRNNIGFFGVIENAEIRNLHLINASILFPDRNGLSSSDRVGGLVGRARGNNLISSSSVFADRIEGSNDVAGLIGRAADGITNVRESAALAISIGISDSGVAAGFIGTSSGVVGAPSNFTNNYAVTRVITVNRTGTIRTGGLLGNPEERNRLLSSYALTNRLVARNFANVGPIVGNTPSTLILDNRAPLFFNNEITMIVDSTDPSNSFTVANAPGSLVQPSAVLGRSTSDFTMAPIFFTSSDSSQLAGFSTLCSPDSRARSQSNTDISVWLQGAMDDVRYPNISCWTADSEDRGVSVDRQRDAINSYLDESVDFDTIINNLRQ